MIDVDHIDDLAITLIMLKEQEFFIRSACKSMLLKSALAYNHR